MVDNKSKFLNITDTPFLQSDPDASLGVSDDVLGNDFKSTIIEFINHSKGPFSIALQGEWGSGKTSLMNYIKSSVCEKDKSEFHSVWINTWQFSVIDSPQLAIVNILSSIINQVTNTADSATSFDKVKSFLYFILKYVIMPIGFLIQIIVLFLNTIGVCKVNLTTIRKQSKDIIEDINKVYKKKDVNNSDTSISVQKLKKNTRV